MRTLSLIFIALAMAAVSFSLPSRAEAFQSAPLVEFLARQACQGQSAPYQSGCNGYLHKRITQCKPAAQAFDECSNLCGVWYATDPVKKVNCEEGCRFLNSKE